MAIRRDVKPAKGPAILMMTSVRQGQRAAVAPQVAIKATQHKKRDDDWYYRHIETPSADRGGEVPWGGAPPRYSSNDDVARMLAHDSGPALPDAHHTRKSWFHGTEPSVVTT